MPALAGRGSQRAPALARPASQRVPVAWRGRCSGSNPDASPVETAAAHARCSRGEHIRPTLQPHPTDLAAQSPSRARDAQFALHPRPKRPLATPKDGRPGACACRVGQDGRSPAPGKAGLVGCAHRAISASGPSQSSSRVPATLMRAEPAPARPNASTGECECEPNPRLRQPGGPVVDVPGPTGQ